MNWKIKALTQILLSSIPFGDHLYYLLQTVVTNSLPRSAQSIQSQIESAHDNVRVFQSYCSTSMEKAIFFEFGAGRELATALGLYCMGIKNQIVTDKTPLIKLNLVNDAIGKINELSIQMKLAKSPENLIPDHKSLNSSLQSSYGINYIAPYSVKDSQIESESVDCVTSTNTLEHIPENTISQILKDCWRILKPNGIIISNINYKDHYAAFDKSISDYNFLKYPEIYWKVVNSNKFDYQNRLRHMDYVRILEKSGFTFLEEQVVEGSVSDLDIIRKLTPTARFGTYSVDELAKKSSRLVFQKGHV